MRSLLFHIIVCSYVRLHLSEAGCPGGIVNFDYDNRKDFNIQLKPNPDKIDAALCLRDAPQPGFITLNDKRQKVTVTGRTAFFNVELLEFEFSGGNMVIVKLLSKGNLKKEIKRRVEDKWTRVSISEKGIIIDEVVISFKMKKRSKGASLRGLSLRSCLQSEGGQTKSKSGLWTPFDSSMSRKEFIQTFGLGQKDYIKALGMASKIKQQIARALKIKVPNPRSLIFGDIVVMPDQLQSLSKQIQKVSNKKSKKGSLRGKRKLSGSFDFYKWDNAEVHYVIDGIFSIDQRNNIRNAILHWEENTCIKFTLKDVSSGNPGHFILFTAPEQDELVSVQNEASRCVSCVGQNRARTPQLILLDQKCANSFGDIVHFIGHAIGYYHETSRPDRDGFVHILKDNIVPQSFFSGFYRFNIQTLGVPYDYGSIMHYPSWIFTKNGQMTIKAKDPLFQQTMGQEIGLSFNDILTANNAYCADKCTSAPACKRGGMRNPNDCSRCICPAGFAGSDCGDIELGSSGCNPRTRVLTVTDTEGCVTSPNYQFADGYDPRSRASCTWLLQAPSGRQISMYFKDAFEVLCRTPKGMITNTNTEPTACLHWVEVKYKGLLTQPGPRFCCYTIPSVQLTSESNEALVNFRNDFEADPPFNMKGFQLCYKLSSTAILPPPPVPHHGDIVQDCSDHYKQGARTSGLYELSVRNSVDTVRVYCDMSTDGGGWTVFQRRVDGSTPFDRNWLEYKNGFGDLQKEFWLGNDILADMTSGPGKFLLRIDLEDFAGSRRFAKYVDFIVGPESEKYRLSIGSYSGDAGDKKGLTHHNGMVFSTKDNGNTYCVNYRGGGGGFWYRNCAWVSLNGKYFATETWSVNSIYWFDWNNATSLRRTQMMFRPVNFI